MSGAGLGADASDLESSWAVAPAEDPLAVEPARKVQTHRRRLGLLPLLAVPSADCSRLINVSRYQWNTDGHLRALAFDSFKPNFATQRQRPFAHAHQPERARLRDRALLNAPAVIGHFET